MEDTKEKLQKSLQAYAFAKKGIDELLDSFRILYPPVYADDSLMGQTYKILLDAQDALYLD